MLFDSENPYNGLINKSNNRPVICIWHLNIYLTEVGVIQEAGYFTLYGSSSFNFLSDIYICQCLIIFDVLLA